MVDLIAQKAQQAVAILKQMDIDMWLIAVRESSISSDPIMPLIIGGEVTWTSFFLFTASGQKIALVGKYDEVRYHESGHFDRVIAFTQGVKEDLLALLNEFQPRQIAINYSLDHPVADGLGHGFYLLLNKILEDSPYEAKLISSEKIIEELTSVKASEEIDRIREACKITNQILQAIIRNVKPGMHGGEIYEFVQKKFKSKKVTQSFDPTIIIGSKSDPGHGVFSNAVLEKGDILFIDFGLYYQEYCSDMSRCIYYLKDDETEPPDIIQRAFETVRKIIKKSIKSAKPGVLGYKLDEQARKILVKAGYPEYQHALGHQIGRNVHDGGTIMAPRWERYGQAPYGELKNDSAFAVELSVLLDGYGVVGLEENILVTPTGGKLLSKAQRRMICV